MLFDDRAVAIRSGALRFLAGALIWAVSPLAFCHGDSVALASLYATDQADRRLTAAPQAPGDWGAVIRRDLARTTAVIKLRNEGKIRSELDHYRAAVILLHGNGLPDAIQAYGVARSGLRRYPESAQLSRILATAWDRMRLSGGRSQWFGTQVVRTGSASATVPDMDYSVMSERERVSAGGMSDKEISDTLAKAQDASAEGQSSTQPSTNPTKHLAHRRMRVAFDAKVLSSILKRDELAAQLYAQLTRTGLRLLADGSPLLPQRLLYLPMRMEDIQSLAATGNPTRDQAGLADELYATVAEFSSATVAAGDFNCIVAIDSKVLPGASLAFNPKFRLELSLRVIDASHAVVRGIRDLSSGQLLFQASL